MTQTNVAQENLRERGIVSKYPGPWEARLPPLPPFVMEAATPFIMEQTAVQVLRLQGWTDEAIVARMDSDNVRVRFADDTGRAAIVESVNVMDAALALMLPTTDWFASADFLTLAHSCPTADDVMRKCALPIAEEAAPLLVKQASRPASP